MTKLLLAIVTIGGALILAGCGAKLSAQEAAQSYKATVGLHPNQHVRCVKSTSPGWDYTCTIPENGLLIDSVDVDVDGSRIIEQTGP